MTDSEALELYKFAYTLKKQLNIPNDEDIIQELVTYACSIYDKFDESRGKKSTFFLQAMKYRYFAMLRDSKTLKRQASVESLNRIVIRDIKEVTEYVDTISDDESNRTKNKLELEKLMRKYKVPEIVRQHYIDKITVRDIAKCKKVSFQAVQQKIAREVTKLRETISSQDDLDYMMKIYKKI